MLAMAPGGLMTFAAGASGGGQGWRQMGELGLAFALAGVTGAGRSWRARSRRARRVAA